MITLPCRWTDGTKTRFRYSVCISTGTMADILKSRKWTDGCIDMGHQASFHLLRLRQVPLSHLHETGVGIEKCNALAEELKKRGIDTAVEDISWIPDEQIDRAECLLDLQLSHHGIEKEGNLWSREFLMEVMNDGRPTGGYLLVKRTFDRLVKIGLDLDAKDFILLDEEEEEALEAFRKGGGEEEAPRGKKQ